MIRLEKKCTGPGLAVDLLAAVSGLSKGRIKVAMQHGAVWRQRVGGKPQRLRRAKAELLEGENLYLYYDEGLITREPKIADLIADEQSYSVWHKPAGLLAQGSKWGDFHSLPRQAEMHLQRTTWLIHRLDREANGLMLLGHSRKVTAKLADLFQKREIDKRYRVSVIGQFPQSAEPIEIDYDVDGRKASSWITRLDYNEATNESLLEVKIDTGRKHQIRKHLSEYGFPVIGDYRYGEPDPRGLQLQAISLSFVCPISEENRKYVLPDDSNRQDQPPAIITP